MVFLRCIVKMTQLLHIKRDLLSKIRNLNSAVERKTSFKEGIDSGIQLMYAKTVLEFDKLNKYLHQTVKELQEHCKTVRKGILDIYNWGRARVGRFGPLSLISISLGLNVFPFSISVQRR